MDVVLSLPPDAAARLADESRRFGHRIVATEFRVELVLTRLAGLPEPPELVVAAASPHHLTAALISLCDSLGVPIAVVAATPVERRHASALGLIDTVAEPSWEALTPIEGAEPSSVSIDVRERALESEPAAIPARRAATERTPQPERQVAPPVELRPPGGSRRGSVVAVWGPGGAPGRTSLAIAIAAELGAAGVYTALGDADTHGAAVAPALGLLDEAPGFAAACRLAGAGGLSAQEFERIGQFHRSSRGGFWVLTGIGRPSRWTELGPERVAGVITAARDWVDVLVLDTAASLEQDEELSSDLVAPRRNGATLEALRSADHIIAVASADPIGLARFLRAHADLRDLTDSARVTVVVNKVRASAIGSGAAGQVRATLARFGGIDDPVLVPWDPAAFDAALLSGRPLAEAAPRSAARVALRRLVAERLVAERLIPSRPAREAVG